MMIVRGPDASRPEGVERFFCCVHCFWKWIDAVVRDRDRGGRLDRKIDWEQVQIRNKE